MSKVKRKLQEQPKGIRAFLAPLLSPSKFKEEMFKGQVKGQIIAQEKRAIAAKGMDRMEQKRGERWVNFWLWVPFWSFLMFNREGKKAEKEERRLK